MMNLFFSKEISPPLFTFNPEESRHIVKVLRLTKHHRISITDGAGRLYSGKIVDDNIKKCTVELDDTVVLEQKKDYKLHIAIALTKNLSRIEWFVEKAVEVGIDEITPMLCRHSERIHFKADRLEKIAIAAVKQSQQLWLPTINELTSFDEIVTKTPSGEGYIAFVDSASSGSFLKSVYSPGRNATILIGPEGDFSEEEISLALKKGFTSISLGKNRLRTETAALFACFSFNILNQ